MLYYQYCSILQFERLGFTGVLPVKQSFDRLSKLNNTTLNYTIVA